MRGTLHVERQAFLASIMEERFENPAGGTVPKMRAETVVSFIGIGPHRNG